jgi:hypothetical protein
MGVVYDFPSGKILNQQEAEDKDNTHYQMVHMCQCGGKLFYALVDGGLECKSCGEVLEGGLYQ